MGISWSVTLAPMATIELTMPCHSSLLRCSSGDHVEPVTCRTSRFEDLLCVRIRRRRLGLARRFTARRTKVFHQVIDQDGIVLLSNFSAVRNHLGNQALPTASVEVQAHNALQTMARRASGLRSEEHTSELQSPCNLVCRLLLEKKKKNKKADKSDDTTHARITTSE